MGGVFNLRIRTFGCVRVILCIVYLYREVLDRDEINEFLRNEIRMSDMREKVTKELSAEGQASESDNKKVDILIQREQTIEQLQKLLEDAITEKDRVTTELE